MSRRGTEDEGQAAVELALVLPLVALLLLGVVQVGLVVRDQVLVVHAAREAAREAAVRPGEGPARAAAVHSSGLKSERLEVDVQGRGAPGGRVVVRLAYLSRTDVPLVGGLVRDVHLSAKAAMRVEE